MEGIVCDKPEVINSRYGLHLFLSRTTVKAAILPVVGNYAVWHFEFTPTRESNLSTCLLPITLARCEKNSCFHKTPISLARNLGIILMKNQNCLMILACTLSNRFGTGSVI